MTNINALKFTYTSLNHNSNKQLDQNFGVKTSHLTSWTWRPSCFDWILDDLNNLVVVIEQDQSIWASRSNTEKRSGVDFWNLHKLKFDFKCFFWSRLEVETWVLLKCINWFPLTNRLISACFAVQKSAKIWSILHLHLILGWTNIWKEILLIRSFVEFFLKCIKNWFIIASLHDWQVWRKYCSVRERWSGRTTRWIRSPGCASPPTTWSWRGSPCSRSPSYWQRFRCVEELGNWIWVLPFVDRQTRNSFCPFRWKYAQTTWNARNHELF